MTMAMAFLAWFSFLLVLYVYFGYPGLLWLFTCFRQRCIDQADITPSVTLLISAFNEAGSIKKKIENTLALDYPRDWLEVLVISDASTDETDEIVRSFTPQNIRLIRMARRGGKTAGLNAAMQAAAGDIIVFSDANILYRPDTIRCLVKNFSDPSVGCVTGDSRYLEEHESASNVQESVYWGYERWIRIMESRLGSTVGGDGAIFAIRRTLYTPLSSDAINDLVVPLQIVAAGYRAVFEPTAVGYEASAGDFRKEFRRKRRIVNRSWRGVMSVPEVLNPLKNRLFAWQVWSHKVLRWLVLPFVVMGTIGCLGAYSRGVIYQIGTWGVLVSLVLAGLGVLIPSRFGLFSRIGHVSLYFYVVNWAALVGVLRALCGNVETVWVPERR